MNKQNQALFITAILDTHLLHSDKELVLNIFRSLTKPPDKLVQKRKPADIAMMTIQQWEASRNAPLTIASVSEWVKDKKLCPVLTGMLIEEFRVDMMSKNKQYADFKLAFQNYVNKGYLSRNLYGLALERSPHREHGTTTINRRGGGL